MMGLLGASSTAGLTLLVLCAASPAETLSQERLQSRGSQGLHDSSTLFQTNLEDSGSAPSRKPRVTDGVIQTPRGPMVLTVDGGILGAQDDGFVLFKSVPYAEPAKRFARAEAKKAWEPGLLNASVFGPSCVGSQTAGKYGETEDCLTLNMWVPNGVHRKMPVLVYFHGGMNQHGSGHEDSRHGDLIVQSEKFPTIFINFDFRLGIFGWIQGEEGSDIPSNIGLVDQQLMLQWVQRHIGAFGGDPKSVTLIGQSEGAGTLLSHLASPGSAGLFQRCIFHSPPADLWSRTANKDRTEFMAGRAGCRNKKQMLRCLRRIPAQKLSGYDWVADQLARTGQKVQFIKAMIAVLKFVKEEKGGSFEEALRDLGWHAVVDGDVLPDEPRRAIAAGRWNKVPILLTVVKNESYGILPDQKPVDVDTVLTYLLKKGEVESVITRYLATLVKSGISPPEHNKLLHQMFTDKVFTCDVRSLAKDIVRTGGKAYLGMFWHSPKFDPIGRQTRPECLQGAACHAADMFYVLPQGRGVGIDSRLPEEIEFSKRYSNDILSFAHNRAGTWAPFDLDSQAVTFYDVNGPRVVNGYRQEQCKVLDSSMGNLLPEFMRETR